MKKTKKILAMICLGAILLLPNITEAVGFNIGADTDGNWSFGIGSDSDSDSGSGSGGLSDKDYGLPGGSIFGIVRNILNWLLGILSVVSLIGFIIAGIMYLTAAGDETQAEKAKKAMLYSIIGVIVGLSGFVVFQAAQYMLSGQSF